MILRLSLDVAPASTLRTETEDPESLGDRDLDRLYDWPITSFDKYDFDDNWWTRSKAEFPCEQVVTVNSSPDTLNPLQRELYEMAVQQYLDELAGRDVKPLRINVDGVAGSGKTYVLLKICARLQELSLAANRPNPVFRCAPGIAAFNILGKTLHSLLRQGPAI